MFAIPDIRESLLAVYDSADPDEVKVAKISTVVEDHQAKQSSRKRYFFLRLALWLIIVSLIGLFVLLVWLDQLWNSGGSGSGCWGICGIGTGWGG